jgi:hypothetical protein
VTTPTSPQRPLSEASAATPAQAPGTNRWEIGIPTLLSAGTAGIAMLRLGMAGLDLPTLGGLVAWFGAGAITVGASLAWLARARSQRAVRAAQNLDAPASDADHEILLRATRHSLTKARERAEEAEGRLAGLRSVIDQLESEVEANLLDRRERISSLEGSLRVAISIAGRPMPARIVDISSDGVVLDVPASEGPDIAPGMFARLGVAWRTQEPPPVIEIRCEGARTVADDLVRMRYRWLKAEDTQLLPDCLRGILEQRRARRVTIPPGAGLIGAVRRHATAKAVAAEVQDLSRSGVRLRIPLTHERLSAWGTRVQVGLSFGTENTPVYLLARVRNVRADEGEFASVGLEFDQAHTPDFERRIEQISGWLEELQKAPDRRPRGADLEDLGEEMPQAAR